MPPKTDYERYAKAVHDPWTAYCRNRNLNHYKTVFQPSIQKIEDKRNLDDISELGMF